MADIIATRRTILGCLSAILILCAGFASTSKANDAESAATKHIENMIVAAEGLLHEDSNDPLKRANAVAGLLDSYFDFPAITRFSAGPYWRAATEAEKREYEQALRQVIISTVVNNFDKLQGLKYNHLASTPKGSKLVLVSGEFIDTTGTRPTVLVNWRVISNPNKGPAVMDIEIENISMLITQKQENVAIIRQNKGKFAALIEAMQKQLDQ